jgi:hypothetical protein
MQQIPAVNWRNLDANNSNSNNNNNDNKNNNNNNNIIITNKQKFTQKKDAKKN